jgi:peptide/nickel transport system substrate-binding protein
MQPPGGFFLCVRETPIWCPKYLFGKYQNLENTFMSKFRLFAGLLILSFILVAFRGEALSQPTTLFLAIEEEPATLDPQRTSDPAAAEVFGRVCETLVYQGVDLADKPLLAESWTLADDALSMTFHIRQDVTFHDGTPLNAEAVKFTFERVQQPESADSPIYEDFQGVEITTPDEYTIVFRFEEPNYDFLTSLRNVYAAILSPTAIHADEAMFARNPVCTGPFQIQEWQVADHILLTRNPAYAWAPEYFENQGSAHIDQIKINFTPEHETRYQALLDGELDMLSLGSAEEIAEIQAMADQFDLYESWVGGISYLGFNYQLGLTKELAVRQALAHAVDKQTIIDQILPTLAQPAFAPLAPTTFGYSPDLVKFEYGFDPEKSKQLLADAGFADSNNDGILEREGQSLEFEILTPTSSTYEKIFGLLRSQFADIGVVVELRQAAASEIAEITPTGEFDLLLYHYFWPYPSALDLFLSSERIGASNRVAYSNSQVDDLLQRASQLPNDSSEKEALLIQAQSIILQDAAWQPLLVRKVVTAVNNRVSGIKVHPSEGLLWHDASISE